MADTSTIESYFLEASGGEDPTVEPEVGMGESGEGVWRRCPVLRAALDAAKQVHTSIRARTTEPPNHSH
jgi:hypothetical protein